MAVWQYLGVAIRKAIGAPPPRAVFRDTSWRGHTGSRVHRNCTPCGSAVVGVSSGTIFWPGPTTLVEAGIGTADCSVAPFTEALTVWLPSDGGVNTTG